MKKKITKDICPLCGNKIIHEGECPQSCEPLFSNDMIVLFEYNPKARPSKEGLATLALLNEVSNKSN